LARIRIQRAAKQQERQDLVDTTPEALWERDLSALRAALAKDASYEVNRRGIHVY
jgi:hypothetical protein